MKTIDKKQDLMLLVIILNIFLNSNVAAQNFLGYTGNYSGISSVYQNPSSIANSKLKLDINIFTFGGHMQNSLYYIPKSSYNNINPFKNGFADFDAYKGYAVNNKRNYLYTREQMYLPSLMFSNGKRAFAFHINWRFEAHVKNIPNDIVRSIYEGMYKGKNITQDLNTVKHADKFHFALASWEELAATYSQTLHHDVHQYFAAGITAKLLLGNAAYFVKNNAMDYYFSSNTGISFQNAHTSFGGVIPKGLINGVGMGADIGVTYAVKDFGRPNNVSEYFNYKYKISLALLDIGGIRFNNARKYHVNSYSSPTNTNGNTVNGLNEIQNTAQGMIVSPNITYFLPAALNAQFDYNFNDFFYVGAQYINNLKFTACQVRRPTILAITPRIEKRKFEMAMPLSLYDWRLPRMGFHIRILNFTFGTESINWLIKLRDFTGVDGYFSVKFNIGKKELSQPLFK